MRASTTPRWLWWLNTTAVVVAALAMVWLLGRTGARQVFDLVRSSGAAIAALVVLDLVVVLLRARALHVLLRPSQRMISLQRVACAQAAASSVQDFTPTGALGDVVKATLLLARAPATEVVSAIVAYDVLTVYVSATIITAGVVIAAALGVVPPPLDRALWGSAALMLVLVLLISWIIRRGVAATLIAATAHLRLIDRARRDRWVARLQVLDVRLRALHARDRGEARQGFALLLLARALGWLQLYVLVRAVSVSPDPGTFVALLLCQIPVSRVATLLPLGMGLSDLGTAGTFALVGLPPAAGMAVAMLGRVRQIAVAVIALIASAVLQLLDRLPITRARARLTARDSRRRRRSRSR